MFSGSYSHYHALLPIIIFTPTEQHRYTMERERERKDRRIGRTFFSRMRPRICKSEAGVNCACTRQRWTWVAFIHGLLGWV